MTTNLAAQLKSTKSEAAGPVTPEKRKLTVTLNDEVVTVWVGGKQLARVSFYQYAESEAILDVHAMYCGYVTFSHRENKEYGVPECRGYSDKGEAQKAGSV